MLKKILLVFCFLASSCFAEEFIYPIVSIDQENIFVMHQKSLEDLHLFIWNTKTKIATQAISAFFLPTDIVLLPSKTGFSFLDRGRIRLKMFQKRTPKTIDLCDPISHISSLSWLNDTQFYFAGMRNKNFQVFACTLQGSANDLICATPDTGHDFMYPQVIQDNLFCVAKSQTSYHIFKQAWHIPVQTTCNLETQSLYSSLEPLCFLHMKNKELGYFLQYHLSENATDLATFSCYQLSKKDTWTAQFLFSFAIPQKYLVGESQQRAYESIAPFLPKYDDHRVYFIDYDQEQGLFFLKKYDIASKNLQIIVQPRRFTSNKGFLAPLATTECMYYGLILSDLKGLASHIFCDETTGDIFLDLPTFKPTGA